MEMTLSARHCPALVFVLLLGNNMKQTRSICIRACTAQERRGEIPLLLSSCISSILGQWVGLVFRGVNTSSRFFSRIAFNCYKSLPTAYFPVSDAKHVSHLAVCVR